MKKYILAGRYLLKAQSSTQPAKVFTSTTLQESGLTISVTAEDIRGGLSNPLLGRYFHDSVLEANIVDALFDLSYLARMLVKLRWYTPCYETVDYRLRWYTCA